MKRISIRTEDLNAINYLENKNTEASKFID